MLARNLRGEVSAMTEEKVSVSDLELIESVAKYMSLGTHEVGASH